MIGLSATVGSPDKVAKFLVGSQRPVEIVRVSVAKMVKLQVIYPKPTEEDVRFSSKIYTHPEVAARLRIIRDYMTKCKSVLLFTNTRSVSEVLASRFKVWDADFPISIHHGSLAKPSRIAAENGLKAWRPKRLNRNKQPRTRHRRGAHRLCYPIHESTASFTAYSACWQSRAHLWELV